MTTITEKLKSFSTNYKTDVEARLSRTLPSYQLLVDEIPSELSQLITQNNINNLNVKGSIGQGNTTYYPWVIVYDNRISTGASNGFYVVLLISDDFENAYLTINQGSFQDQIVQEKYKSIVLNTIREIDDFTFGQLPQHSLVKTQPYNNTNNGKKYENSNMLYKKYLISSLIEDDFIRDLLKIVKQYSICVEAYLNENNEVTVTPTPRTTRTIREERVLEGGFQIPKEFQASLVHANLVMDTNLIIRFISLLCTKPFVILTGLSGSGKTKLAQAFAQWICEDENQYCIIPVGADWTNREPLLGYPNALQQGDYITSNGVLRLIIGASINPFKPYFLILDEMNLSHVERYFADFLSAIESGEFVPLHPEEEVWRNCNIPAKINIPNNLFIIGTVNIDETTYMFSPKVLDRAGVIEFRVAIEEMNQFLDSPGKPDMEQLKKLGSTMADDFVKLATTDLGPLEENNMKDDLLIFFTELKKTGAEFGYRTASDIYRFSVIVNKLIPVADKWTKDQIIDAAIIQKLLPKLHGSRKKLEPVLKTLAGLCFVAKNMTDEDWEKIRKEGAKSVENIRYPLSLEKILRMYNRVIQDGFTSFAEA